MKMKVKRTDRIKSLMGLFTIIVAFYAMGLISDAEGTPEYGSNCNAILTLKSTNFETMSQYINHLKIMGVKIVHKFPPSVVIGYIPPAKQNAVSKLNFILKINYSYALYNPNDSDKMKVAAYYAWNNYFIDTIVPDRPVPNYPPPNDMKVTPIIKGKNGKATESDGPNGRSLENISEFFIGDVVLSVIFPESTGPGENWTISQFDYTMTQEVAAMDWLYERMTESETGTPITSDMNLAFTYIPYEVTTTDVEPIDQPSSSHPLAGNFIDDAMVDLGYNTGGVWAKVYNYVNDQMANYNADWGFVSFVVNDDNDADHMFPDGTFAYAYLGGPFSVITYNNDGYGPSNMNAVIAHETGHVFYALDEYVGGTGAPCDDYSGYLDIQNANSLTGPASGGTCDQYMNCLMQGGISPWSSNSVCKYTKFAWGWEDVDASGVFDVLDFEPHNEFTEVPTDPTLDFTPTFRGRAYIDLENPPPYDVLPNLNPYPFKSHDDLTINTISNLNHPAVEYTYTPGPGTWLPCNPDDGAYDQTIEFWTITTVPLSPGTYTFTFRTWNSAGLFSDIYYIFTISGTGTPTATPEVDFDPPQIDTPYPPCESLLWGPCDPNNPTLQPDPGVSNSRTVTIGCIVRDPSGVDASTIQYHADLNGDNDYNDFGEGWIDWDNKLAPHPDDQNIQCTAKVTFLTDKNGLHFEFRAYDIRGNGYGYSGKNNPGIEGIMDDWIVNVDSTPPYIVSATALDTSGKGIGIQTGDTVTIVFSDTTNAPLINSINVNSILHLNNGHSWLDSSSNILNVEWVKTNSINDTLVLTLQATAAKPPSVAIGDIVSTDEHTITDLNANPVVTNAVIKGSFADPMGPDTKYIRVNNQEGKVIIPWGTPEIQVKALFSDDGRGDNPIAAAEYFIDDSGIPVGGGYYMAPEDGSYDEVSEVAIATFYIPASWTKDSAHTIYARGQDSAGNWGTLNLAKAVTVFNGENGPDCLIPPKFNGLTYCDSSTAICGGVDLRWDIAEDPNDTPFTYNIYISDKSGFENFDKPDLIIPGRKTTEWTIKPSDFGSENNRAWSLYTKYYFVVRATDSCFNEESNIVELSAMPKDPYPPLFAGIKSATDISCRTVRVLWNAGDDKINAGCFAWNGTLKYLIYKSSIPKIDFSNPPDYWTYDPKGIFLNNLTPNITHYFAVRAEDEANDFNPLGPDKTQTHHTTGITNTQLTDKYADWMIDMFQDCYLYPNVYRNFRYKIVSNTTSTITVEPGSQMVTPFGAKVGDGYFVDCQGNMDNTDPIPIDNAIPTWNTYDSMDDDLIYDEDEIPPYITGRIPSDGSDSGKGYIEYASFKIFDNCSGVVRNSIKLWVDYVNVTNKLLITPITGTNPSTGAPIGGYLVEYYSLNPKLYNLTGTIKLIIEASDYYGNMIHDENWEISTWTVPINLN
jgi:hypothetical protein